MPKISTSMRITADTHRLIQEMLEAWSVNQTGLISWAITNLWLQLEQSNPNAHAGKNPVFLKWDKQLKLFESSPGDHTMYSLGYGYRVSPAEVIQFFSANPGYTMVLIP